MTILLDLIYGFALLLGWWFLLYRRWQRGPSGVPLREYFGRVPSRPVSARCVWIHGVSLGEMNATRTLVGELRPRSSCSAARRGRGWTRPAGCTRT